MGSLPCGTTAPRGLPSPEFIQWPLVPARELFELRYGRALVEGDRRPGEIAVYGTNGRCGSHEKPLFSGPGVILGRKGQGPLGVEWSEDDYWVIDTAYSLAPIRKDIDLRYAYFLIKFVGLNHLKDGTSNPTLSRDTFGAQALPFPPLRDQNAIAHILGTLDDKIELNRRMSETLESIAQALFKSWFVDFDPVRAKAEGRERQFPKHVVDLFPSSFEDSPLGKIPKGWGVGSLLDHAKLLSGGTPKTDRPEYWGGPIHWASAKDVSQSASTFLIATERQVTQRGVDESATQIVPARSCVIVARGATTGRMVLLGRDMAMNQTCYALSTLTNTPYALYCQLREGIDGLVHAAHGSVFDTITTSTFASSRIVLPLHQTLRAFEDRASPLFERMLESNFECDALVTARDSLLPKLISGEVRVRHAEKCMDLARAQ